MNRELLKKNYMEQKEFDTVEERADKEKNYEAHHIAVLDSTLMDNQENCLLLRSSDNSKELLEHQEYVNWLMTQDRFDELKITDMQGVKVILKPIKKALKNTSKERILKEVLKNLNKEENHG